MKIFMLVIDGLSDDPNPTLRGRTPLAAAAAPNLQELAAHSQRGFVKTVHGFSPESLSCIAGLLGYTPDILQRLGRASFEAAARGVALSENDLAFRCNIVALAQSGDSIADFTSGAIGDADAAELLKRISLPREEWELHQGQGYRNLLLIRDARVRASDLLLFPPHMHQREPLGDILPQALKKSAVPLVADLRQFMRESRERLGPAHMLWLWSPSQSDPIPKFADLHGIKGAVVAGLDFLNGLGAKAGMFYKKIAGATGYLDTDYAAKAAAAISWFETADFVLLHVNATDEAAHARDAAAKIEAIESTDRLIAGPLIRFLRQNHHGDFTVVVCGDHKTSSVSGLHGEEPVPYFIYRDFAPLPADNEEAFTEIMSGEQVNSYELLKNIRPVKSF